MTPWRPLRGVSSYNIYKMTISLSGYDLYKMTLAFFGYDHLHNIKATSTFILRFTPGYRGCGGHRIMNNSRGLQTNQQARLQENKQFFRGSFNKWMLLPVNQVKVLQSVSGYL